MKTFIQIKQEAMVKNKYLKFSYLLAVVTIIVLNSCGTTNTQALFNSANGYDIANLKDIYVVNDKGVDDVYYKIKVNDEITIRNLQNTEWGSTKSASVGGGASIASTDASQAGSQGAITYKIGEDGMANLPAIGKVLLAGLTRKEATQKLQDSYGNAKHLTNPIIELNVVNLQVTLLGEFNKQGNFKLEKENTHLFEIVGEAGGLTKIADPKTLKIIRGNKANPEEIYVNLQNQKSLANRKLILQNGDLILVEKTKSAQIAENLQKSNNIIQPILVVVNLAILIFTLTK